MTERTCIKNKFLYLIIIFFKKVFSNENFRDFVIKRYNKSAKFKQLKGIKTNSSIKKIMEIGMMASNIFKTKVKFTKFSSSLTRFDILKLWKKIKNTDEIKYVNSINVKLNIYEKIVIKRIEKIKLIELDEANKLAFWLIFFSKSKPYLMPRWE